MTAPSAPRAGPLTSAERRAWERGRRCYQRGDRRGALVAYRELLRTRGGFADVHYRVATLLEEQGELEGAVRHLREAIASNPHYVEALLALASLAERQGDFDRSRELAERAREAVGAAVGAVRSGPDPTTQKKLANLHAQLGDAYREAGELREALLAYRKSLERCPQFHDVRFRLALTLREAGRPDAALAELRRLIRLRPDYRQAAVQLGVTLYSLGRSGEAIAQWRAVLAAEPGRRDARMYLRLLGASDGDREE